MACGSCLFIIFDKFLFISIYSLLTLVYSIEINQAIARSLIFWYSYLNGSIFGKKLESRRNPARIPPQTPPAGGKSAEAERILSPRQIVSPCRVRISIFNHLDFARNSFELCPTNTAMKLFLFVIRDNKSHFNYNTFYLQTTYVVFILMFRHYIW